MKNADFVGRDALSRIKAEGGGPLRLVTFTIEATDADALGDEPVWHDGKVVGWVTSGGYGHSVGRSLAMGYIPKAIAKELGGFEIEILGERRAATRVEGAPFDPDGTRMRA